ncbi:hypothetical protein AB0P32_04495 [Streptomyces sp. NPDC085995]|uniref:hypothetical protein n=1 Tax=Streptomyces sp. NPDC085995 TaxID=3154861 RepID=UPI003415A9A7
MRLPTTARRTAVAVLLASALTACGDAAPREYGTDERAVSVSAGEKFTLQVPVAGYMGENWYLASPSPDAKVLRYRGKRRKVRGMSDGHEYFDFTAQAAGTATVKLLHCPNGLCHSEAEARAQATRGPSPRPLPTATGTPGDDPEYFVYRVTVG